MAKKKIIDCADCGFPFTEQIWRGKQNLCPSCERQHDETAPKHLEWVGGGMGKKILHLQEES